MALPTQRHTKSRRNRRRSHLALKQTSIVSCKKCGKPSLPHRMCEYCGTYKGRMVIDVIAKLDKKEQKKRKREQAEHEHEHVAEKSEKVIQK
ncbi:MAG: 50S ribosomal protein L32 [Candidatus Spechtbacteria bacterium]|nr:50S ribosomal protein L32 [Candidatus Spechtbacteria bacterium]